MNLKANMGTIWKGGLFSGSRKDEPAYMYDKPICPDEKCSIDGCKLLQVENKKNSMSMIVMNWSHSKKSCYICTLPTWLWQEFRALPKLTYYLIIYTCLFLKASMEIKPVYFRKTHYNMSTEIWSTG
jgi:hypothetical protein